MSIEKRIQQIAAKKIKVIITGKTRNQDGFRVVGPGNGINGTVTTHHRTKKEALNALLVRIRCKEETLWHIAPVSIKPNPALKSDVPWKRKLL